MSFSTSDTLSVVLSWLPTCWSVVVLISVCACSAFGKISNRLLSVCMTWCVCPILFLSINACAFALLPNHFGWPSAPIDTSLGAAILAWLSWLFWLNKSPEGALLARILLDCCLTGISGMVNAWLLPNPRLIGSLPLGNSLTGCGLTVRIPSCGIANCSRSLRRLLSSWVNQVCSFFCAWGWSSPHDALASFCGRRPPNTVVMACCLALAGIALSHALANRKGSPFNPITVVSKCSPSFTSMSLMAGSSGVFISWASLASRSACSCCFLACQSAISLSRMVWDSRCWLRATTPEIPPCTCGVVFSSAMVLLACSIASCTDIWSVPSVIVALSAISFWWLTHACSRLLASRSRYWLTSKPPLALGFSGLAPVLTGEALGLVVISVGLAVWAVALVSGAAGLSALSVCACCGLSVEL